MEKIYMEFGWKFLMGVVLWTACYNLILQVMQKCAKKGSYF